MKAAHNLGAVPLSWANGLLPCIVQDARTGAVLMLAWMSPEAMARTIQTGETWFWSRSRGALWHKGETSGNTQRVVGMRVDCDGDAILTQVVPGGPACHTGQPSCFYRTPEGRVQSSGPVLSRLEETIGERRRTMPEKSYTAALLRGGLEAIGAKVAEEAEEVVRAAREETPERVAEEAADVLYHLLVLLGARGVPLTQVLDVLATRSA
ncbi:MAG: bifunctional phosphoribosyl-AMP cyclohydrolase/phosphoribosyl-ATP diphosphatase HisIE [bacterium]